MLSAHIEIERKFLIKRPDEAMLEALPGCEWTDITQTYIRVGDDCNERVRMRGRAGMRAYTHTVKKRVSDTRSIENEREITQAEYLELISKADKSLNVINKRRYVLERGGDRFEIDIYPFWRNQAVLELEMTDETRSIEIPPELTLIRELTGLREYGNAALSRRIPDEDEEGHYGHIHGDSLKA